MKIGLFGINTSVDESIFLQIKDALGKNLHCIFSTQHDDLLPLSEKYGIKLYSSSSELFSAVDAVFFARSLKPNYEFAIKAIKNSCHLFIEDISTLSIDETKQLFKVAFEARSIIHLKQTKLFYPEYIELSDYIEKPKLIELNSDFNYLLRKQNYFIELFNRLCFADEITNSSIKKVSTIAIPIDRSHFSLVKVRVDYDNGTFANIKLNNLSTINKDNLLIHQKDSCLDLDFENHFAIMHKLENGQVIRSEFNIENNNAFANEVKYFIGLCNEIESENISESPAILKTIQNTFLLMNQLDQILLKV